IVCGWFGDLQSRRLHADRAEADRASQGLTGAIQIAMLRMVLVRPGATDFDEQGRIKGTLDIPLSAQGTDEVAQTVNELADVPLEVVYSAPCQCAEQTAAALASSHRTKVKTLEELHNLDHGLWHGK